MIKETSIVEINKKLGKFITSKESWNPVEKNLFTMNSYFTNYNKNHEMSFDAIKYSFNHHYNNNLLYKRLCEINNIQPDNINT